jgi:hypothetical protein
VNSGSFIRSFTQTRCYENWSNDIQQRVAAIEHRVRYAERLPLGLSYVDQVGYVRRLLNSRELPRKETELVIDRTGVGAAVSDLFRSEGLAPVQVAITGGDQEVRDGARVLRCRSCFW